MTTKQYGRKPTDDEQAAIDDITADLLGALEGKSRSHAIAAAGDAFINTLRFVKADSRIAAFDEYTKHARAVLVADLAEEAGDAHH